MIDDFQRDGVCGERRSGYIPFVYYLHLSRFSAEVRGVYYHDPAGLEPGRLSDEIFRIIARINDSEKLAVTEIRGYVRPYAVVRAEGISYANYYG